MSLRTWPSLGQETYSFENSRTAPRTMAPMHDFPPIDVAVLQTLFDLTPDVAFFIKDASGRYHSVNDSLIIRHGLTGKSDAIGKRPQVICSGEFGRTPSEQDAQVLRTGKPIIDHLELQLHRPHAPIWCLTTKLPMRDMHGEVIRIIGFSRDVRVPVERSDIPEGLASAMSCARAKLQCQAGALPRIGRTSAESDRQLYQNKTLPGDLIPGPSAPEMRGKIYIVASAC